MEIPGPTLQNETSLYIGEFECSVISKCKSALIPFQSDVVISALETRMVVS